MKNEVQISPFESFSNTDDEGEKHVQVCDRAALQNPRGAWWGDARIPDFTSQPSAELSDTINITTTTRRKSNQPMIIFEFQKLLTDDLKGTEPQRETFLCVFDSLSLCVKTHLRPREVVVDDSNRPQTVRIYAMWTEEVTIRGPSCLCYNAIIEWYTFSANCV